jgi:hypothetical protein
MTIVAIILFFLSVGVITYGRRRSQIQEYGLFFYEWRYAPLFQIGITYDRAYPSPEMEVDTFSLGLAILVIEFNFYRFTNVDNDAE